MKRFLHRFFIFIIPFLCMGIAAVPFVYIGFEIGEINSFDRLIENQRADKSIYIGMGYNEQTGYYKLQNANYYQADVLALGTSRVMQFRADYFSGSFYNCGGAVAENYDEYLNFLENLAYKPKVVIVGLDAWVFNDAWNHSCHVFDKYMPVMPVERNKISVLWSIAEDFADHKWDWNAIQNYAGNYGFNGRVKNAGFRWDGSYYYGDIYRELDTKNAANFQDTFERIDGGTSRFEWGEHADHETYEYLAEFLKYCKDNGIEAVGFATPFAPSVYHKMIESGNYGYLAEISPRCRELFDEYGYMYFDYMDSTVLELDDTYYIDGFHGSEVAYANIMSDMVDKGSSLKEYIDENKLNELFANCNSSLLLYDGSQ